MTPEEKNLLNRVVELSEENNKILRGMRRSARWAAVFRWFYWLVILGGAVSAYYFIQPYINALVEGVNGVKENISKVGNLTDKLPDLSNLLGGKR